MLAKAANLVPQAANVGRWLVIEVGCGGGAFPEQYAQLRGGQLVLALLHLQRVLDRRNPLD